MTATPPGAQAQEADQPNSPTIDNQALGFGTISKVNFSGQALLIGEYNWEKNEPEDVKYQYNVTQVKVINMAAITELKPGDDVEFEWYFWGPSKIKFITKISKGPMPSEPITMDFNFNLSEDEPADTDGVMQPVEVKTEGVDVAAPEVIQIENPGTADAAVITPEGAAAPAETSQ